MILVTGATGLVGSHLVLHLIEQGQSVKALFRSDEGKQRVKKVFEHYQKKDLFDKIIWCQADILDVYSLEIAFQDIDYVYHCAALISFDPKNESELRKTNIEGTANIVNFCIDYKVKKLCHMSSIAALGDLTPTENIVSEETEWNPEKEHSDYAISKYGAEMEVWRAQQEGLSVVIVNPGVILGPLFWTEGSGEIYQNVKNGLSFYTKGSTGFVVVSDVVEIMVQLMQSNSAGERFVLISENKNYKDLVFLIAEMLKAKKPKFYANKVVTSFAWRADWFLATVFGKKRMLTKDLAASLHSLDIYSNEKIKKQLNYHFQKVDDFLLKKNII
ncbi:NAD-dependent epimerase/dehydratase family protein [Flavobacterium sp.]|uniref:NAD-dependent epimerase/dehydratase family protein n=1 Tax=Flavobacterium sp. TaxID=239 RepID=UPI002621A023|nr:NAD-dependent epimerase/dehydratase family protein [Flavobacterium sp.]